MMRSERKRTWCPTLHFYATPKKGNQLYLFIIAFVFTIVCIPPPTQCSIFLEASLCFLDTVQHAKMFTQKNLLDMLAELTGLSNLTLLLPTEAAMNQLPTNFTTELLNNKVSTVENKITK